MGILNHKLDGYKTADNECEIEIGVKKTEYTNDQLKRALAKMLPERLDFDNHTSWTTLNWKNGLVIFETELLHICWLIEENLTNDQQAMYEDYFDNYRDYHANWDVRTIALAKVKGIEI